MILIHSVRALDRFNVELGFSNGEQKVVDLEPLLRGPIFDALKQDPKLFRSVHVNEEFGTIVWDNGADMDPDVWKESEKVKST